MRGHTHLKRENKFEETFDVYLLVKNQLHHWRFPWYIDIAKFLFWVLWACLVIYTHCGKSPFISVFISRPKINIISHVFLEILQRYANILFWVPYAWLYTLKMIVSTYVYVISKNKLYPSLLFSDITLKFDWPTTFWPIPLEPEFCKIWDWWWNITITFHLRLFPGITNTFCQKIKKPILGSFWALSAQTWSIPEKNIDPLLKKNTKLTDRQIGRHQ